MNNNVSSPNWSLKCTRTQIIADTPIVTPVSNTLISWTAIGQNKLKEYKLVTRGANIKLDIKGKNFTEWNESVATHAKSMSMNELFSYSPPGTNSYAIHDEFPVKKSFFENHGTISLEQV